MKSVGSFIWVTQFGLIGGRGCTALLVTRPVLCLALQLTCVTLKRSLHLYQTGERGCRTHGSHKLFNCKILFTTESPWRSSICSRNKLPAGKISVGMIRD